MAFVDVFCLFLLYSVVFVRIAYALPDSVADSKSENTSLCEKDWKQYDQYCYKFETTLLPWGNATFHCKSLGGSLASIHSEDQHEFLEDILKESTLLASWIGFHDHELDLNFEWQDGSSVDYTDFYFELELDILLKRKYCAAMFAKKKRHVIMWNVHECSERASFFCQKQANVLSMNADNKSSEHLYSCEKNWKKYDQLCYKFEAREMNWTNAFKHCRSIRGTLVIIKSSEQRKFLEDTIRKLTRYDDGGVFSWIGLHDYDQDGTFDWVDGTTLDRNYWNLDRHVGRHERCAFMHLYTSSNVVEWNIQDCTKEEAFFCQKAIPPSSGSKGYISITIVISLAIVALIGGLLFYRRRGLDRNLTGQVVVYFKNSYLS